MMAKKSINRREYISESQNSTFLMALTKANWKAIEFERPVAMHPTMWIRLRWIQEFGSIRNGSYNVESQADMLSCCTG